MTELKRKDLAPMKPKKPVAPPETIAERVLNFELGKPNSFFFFSF